MSDPQNNHPQAPVNQGDFPPPPPPPQQGNFPPPPPQQGNFPPPPPGGYPLFHSRPTPVFTDIPSAAKKWSCKILIIIIALLFFQIPLHMVQELVKERREKADSVQSQIAESWAGAQTVQFSPAAASESIDVEIVPEIRYRGIYQMVVYTSKIKIKSQFKNLPAADKFVIKMSDSKGVVNVSALVDGSAVDVDKSLQIPLPVGDSTCEIELDIRGSGKFNVVPAAGTSNIKIYGNWSSPGFIGNTLPDKRTIEDNKFAAEWNFGKFNREENGVGVDLCITAGTYQQVERCFTYATFFLIVFFFTLVASELATKVPVHVLQYLVAAGAPVLFYLMTLAFSEKIGFTAGYLVSAAVIVAMVTMYARMFLGKMFPALLIGVIFAGSYMLNFILLRMEDMALITGTVVLAVILGVLMVLTGKINRNRDTEQ